MKTLLLSAGHYPARTGASWKGTKEHDVAVKWVDEIADYLTWKGVNVVQIASKPLKDKVQNVNSWTLSDDCIAVELHFNSAGATYVQGNETLYYPNSKAGKSIATTYNSRFIQSAMAWVVKDRGIKEGWYKMDRPGIIDFYGDKDGDEMPDYWLRKTACPALILEPVFMCQLDDIGNEWVEVAHSIADALIEVLK